MVSLIYTLGVNNAKLKLLGSIQKIITALLEFLLSMVFQLNDIF